MIRHSFFLSSKNWKRENVAKYVYELLRSLYNMIQIRNLSGSAQKTHSVPWQPPTGYRPRIQTYGAKSTLLLTTSVKKPCLFPSLSDAATPGWIQQCNLLDMTKGTVISHNVTLIPKTTWYYMKRTWQNFHKKMGQLRNSCENFFVFGFKGPRRLRGD